MAKITSMKKLVYFIFHEIYYAVLPMNELETMVTVDNNYGQDYFCELF